MPLAPKTAPESAQPGFVPGEAVVREQLDRLLVHPLFANSKRYPALLEYVVDQTLRGNSTELKERSIGIDVFGRSPAYDANADPVVRITAGEVRKRLTQYYYDSTHSAELVIELPIGSYVPVFRVPEPTAVPASRTADPVVAEPAAEIQTISATTTAAAEGGWILRWVPWLLVGIAAAVAGTIGYRTGLRKSAAPPLNTIDRFWAPMTSGPNTTTYCLGEPAKNIDVASINSFDAPVPPSKPEQLYVRLHLSGHLALADVITLTRTVAPVEALHKTFRVVPASEASFAQLREGPIVLIGAFDNIWTLRITQKLRFGFDSKDGVALIVDRKSQVKTTWATAWDLPYEKLSRDYAIVARIRDNTTGQPVIIAAGISEEGTEAAGEILYNQVYLDKLLEKAPPDWEQKNMEAVIETQVIEGHPGPPQVEAVEFW